MPPVLQRLGGTISSFPTPRSSTKHGLECFDCWLDGRCKNWVVGCWRGYLSGARCGLAYGPADATATHYLFASVKSRLVLPFWYRLTRVVPDKGPLNGRVCAAAQADSSLTKSSNDFWRSPQNCYPEDLNPTRFVKSKYGYSVTH